MDLVKQGSLETKRPLGKLQVGQIKYIVKYFLPKYDNEGINIEAFLIVT